MPLRHPVPKGQRVWRRGRWPAGFPRPSAGLHPAQALSPILIWGTAICAALVVLAGLFRLLVFTDVFHTVEQRRLGTADRFPQASPAEVTDQLQDYFRADGLHLIDSELLSYRERLHYKEVKHLIRRANRVLLGAGFALAALLLGLAFTVRGRSGGTPGVVALVCGRVAVILVSVMAVCAVLALNFDTSFVRFHLLLFESHNWILPPYSASARLFPQRYFIDFLLAFSGLVLGAAALFLAAARLTQRTSR